jgi:hypothetical protein
MGKQKKRFYLRLRTSLSRRKFRNVTLKMLIEDGWSVSGAEKKMGFPSTAPFQK